ncbi:MAG: asparagine synthase-related protein [Nitrososphaerota archaeon]
MESGLRSCCWEYSLMIGLAVAKRAEEARSIAESIAAAQRYRLTRPHRLIEIETAMGFACVAAREGEILEKSDRLIACAHYPPLDESRLEKLLESEDHVRSLRGLDQFFSGVIIDRESIMLFRDHVGHMPVGYAKTAKALTAALSRSALGPAAKPLEPGHMLILNSSGSRIIRWYDPAPWAMSSPEELAERLMSTAEKYLPEQVFLGFSGGLDSSILAHLAALLGRRVKGITVAMKGSLDYLWARETADLLGIELEILEPDDAELAEAASLLLSHLPRAGLMDLSIGSIVLLAARRARGMLVVGQGADELFGGYWRYEKAVLEGGIEAAAELMKRDVERIHERNLERDELAAALTGSQLLAPYVAKSIYETALSIDPGLKLRILDGRVIRKWILRRAAEILGIPVGILEKPKKAAQYSSGIQKRLGKILAEKKMGLRIV